MAKVKDNGPFPDLGQLAGAAGVVSPLAVQQSKGESFVILEAATPIPPELLAVGNVVATPGPEAFLYRIKALEQAGTAPESRVLVLENLAKQGEEKRLTVEEVSRIRPIGFLIPDRPWGEFKTFKEGGYYQAFPNGKLYQVRQGYFVDPSSGAHIYGAKPEDRKALPRLIPVFVERWVPPAAEAPRR